MPLSRLCSGLEPELLPKMVDFTIRTYYPEIWSQYVGAAAAADTAGLEPQQVLLLVKLLLLLMLALVYVCNHQSTCVV